MKRFLKMMPGYKISLRFRIGTRYYKDPLKRLSQWILLGKEDSNFYYKINSLNRNQIISSLAFALETSFENVERYVLEIEDNKEFESDVEEFFRRSNTPITSSPDLGRRIAWYALTRILKPKVVVETGVAHGLGACVISCALIENEKEGFSGEYFGTDIDPAAGVVYQGVYSTKGRVLFGDSKESLKNLDKKIDLFINDSDHDPKYEYEEYLIVEPKLTTNAWILGDNAHASESLLRFSREKNRRFLFIAERPEKHWYPGAGVGISIR